MSLSESGASLASQCRATASASGLRQVLPLQTKRTVRMVNLRVERQKPGARRAAIGHGIVLDGQVGSLPRSRRHVGCTLTPGLPGDTLRGMRFLELAGGIR